MMPIAPLMIEHRLIERMIKAMEHELQALTTNRTVRPDFLDIAVDFIRSYADHCHHGKEEDILFKLLGERKISAQHSIIMSELIREHVQARDMTRRLAIAKERYVMGEDAALEDIVATMRELVRFYPLHIEKEDRHFFVPCMDYFTGEERDDMLRTFHDFDRHLFHERYRLVVERFER